MRLVLTAFFLLGATVAFSATSAPQRVSGPRHFPVALDPNFQFRKFKIYTLSDNVPRTRGQNNSKNPSDLTTRGNFKSKSAVQDASINFERQYRLYGAVTAYDQRQRHGQYYDFFWRSQRPSDVVVRFEYKQEKLRAFAQAQEVGYQNARGTVHTAFQVIGDEYNDDGPVLAWRCLIIEHGRIVAEKRSFLWE